MISAAIQDQGMWRCRRRSEQLGQAEHPAKKICDANDLLVFSWEQKGFQYGEPNQIHYLTISSKLMQDCASQCALRKRVPDGLRWAGLETSILAGCGEGFPELASVLAL